MVTKGTQPSRWMKKLTEEKKKKLKILQHLEQKIQKTHKKPAPPSNYKNVKSSLMQPGTSFKTITSASKQKLPIKKKSKGQKSLANEINAAVSATNTPTVKTAAAGAAAQQHNAAKGKYKGTSNEENVSDTVGRAKELLEVEKLVGRVNHQEKQSTSPSNTQELQEDREGIECSDLHLSIRSYLEACWFAGETERAHNFLLSQHRVRRRRKHLNTDVYNIIMRVWAKKVSLPLNILSYCGVC